MDKLLKARNLNPIRFSKNVRKPIEEMTEVVTKHVLTPELALRLLTPNCRLWKSRWEESPFPEPFWAFYWPGGEALTRYLLDNPQLVRGRQVLDLGCGCGSLAIAAALVQTSSSVTANDIDPIAAVAVELNAELNKLKPNSIYISTEDLLQSTNKFGDNCSIFLGDMFYNEDFSRTLMKWLLLAVDKGAEVYIGDPGRSLNIIDSYKKYLKLVAHYYIDEEYRNVYELKSRKLFVWKLSR